MSDELALIWLHGLGASGADMSGVARMMNLGGLSARHLFLDAPERPVTLNQGMIMPAWYDIVGMQAVDREDEQGILASRKLIESVIQELETSGFQSEQILLIGFSQGAAMAFQTGLHYPRKLAGIVALSGYLPLAKKLKPALPLNTPFFIGYGRYDNVVMPAWSQQSVQDLQAMGYQNIQVEDYPMEHSICSDEIRSISTWIRTTTVNTSRDR